MIFSNRQNAIGSNNLCDMICYMILSQVFLFIYNKMNYKYPVFPIDEFAGFPRGKGLFLLGLEIERNVHNLWTV